MTEKQLFSPLGENAGDDATTLSTFQVTFIEGGLILTAAVHHNCSDGPSCNGLLTTWAENSAAASRGEPFSPIDVANTSRDQLSAPSRAPNASGSCTASFPSSKASGRRPPPGPVARLRDAQPQDPHVALVVELKAACAQADKEQ